MKKDFAYYLKIRSAITRNRKKLEKEFDRLYPSDGSPRKFTQDEIDLMLLYARFKGIEDWISLELLPNLKDEEKGE